MQNPHIYSLLSQMCRVDSVWAGRGHFSGDWFLSAAARGTALLHCVVEGEAIATYEDGGVTKAIDMRAGDLCLFPYGDNHFLSATDMTQEKRLRATNVLSGDGDPNEPFQQSTESNDTKSIKASTSRIDNIPGSEAPDRWLFGSDCPEADELHSQKAKELPTAARLVCFMLNLPQEQLETFGKCPTVIHADGSSLNSWLWDALNGWISPCYDVAWARSTVTSSLIVSEQKGGRGITRDPSGHLVTTFSTISADEGESRDEGFVDPESATPEKQLVLRRLTEIPFITLFMRWLSESKVGVGAALRDDALKVAIEAFFEAPSHPWPNHQLAAACGLSESTFTRRWKACTGSTPQRSFRGFRLAMARKLVSDGNSPERAAELTGLQLTRLKSTISSSGEIDFSLAGTFDLGSRPSSTADVG